jgi:enoyl-CoA hydratase/carnithine racemase
MEFRHVALLQEQDHAVVVMRRPAQRNALSEEHLRELVQAFREVGDGKARGAILAAEGKVFSSGHDFRDMESRGLVEMQRLLDLCRELMETIQAIPQPVVAQVQGLATAAGCQLVATCDLAVAAESARFAVPGGRGGWFCTTPGVALVRAVGRKRALEMLLTGDPIDARTAADWGLVNRVVPDEALAAETRALLARATRGSALSKGLGKRAFYRQVDLPQAGAYDLATEVMAASSQTEDARENLRAFLEKRPPRFSDR